MPTLRQMLDNGVHFGHVKSRWNPKMKPYIFTTRDNIHVIDLEKTRGKLSEAINFLSGVVERGGSVLFVGTKRQARDLVKQAARDSGMPFVVVRWFGGTLTNFAILRSNVGTLEKIEASEANGDFEHLTKKERLKIEEKKHKLALILEGLRGLDRLPQALFVVDTIHEAIAIAEARNLNIPVVAITDTNSNPTKIDYPIPANDDAAKSLTLILNTVSTALKSAHTLRQAQKVEAPVVEEKTAEKTAA